MADPTMARSLEHVAADEVEVLGPSTLAPRRSARDILTEIVLLLPNVARLVYRLLRDRRTPIRRKVLAAGILAYIISPIDVIPDLIPGLGFLDDAILATVALHVLARGIGRGELMELWDGSEDALDLVLSVFEWGMDLVPEPIRSFLDR